MAEKMPEPTTEERVRSGQSVALGDTGTGNTGVPEFEQGISNRPGDHAEAGDEQVEEADEEKAPQAGSRDSS